MVSEVQQVVAGILNRRDIVIYFALEAPSCFSGIKFTVGYQLMFEEYAKVLVEEVVARAS